MSAYPPPIIISTIYNPAFFEASAEDTISQAQANALYLKKKTADTATALETFSAGIATNSLGSIAGTLSLGGLDIINMGTSSGRSAACSINTIGSGITNIAGNSGQTIRKFGATNGTDYQFDNTNLITATANMALYSTQTSGRLDIGTGSRLTTGQGGGINIGTGSGGVANPITVGGASSALTLNGGVITIGNGFSTTSLNGTSIISNLGIDSVDRVTAGTLSIGTVNANLVNISQTGINTAILGTLSVADSGGVKTVNVDTVPAAGTLTIGTVNASLVNISKTGTNTAILGTLSVADAGGLKTVAVDTTSATTLSIGTVNANPVNISRTGTNTAILGTLSVAETTTLNGGLTMGTSNNITLGNGTVAPTGKQLGTTISSTNIFNGAITTVSGTMGTLTIVDAGKYLLNWIFMGSYVTFTAFSVALGGTNVTSGINFQTARDASTYSLSGSYVVQCTASTYTLSWYNITSGFNNQSAFSFFTATRIG